MLSISRTRRARLHPSHERGTGAVLPKDPSAGHGLRPGLEALVRQARRLAAANEAHLHVRLEEGPALRVHTRVGKRCDCEPGCGWGRESLARARGGAAGVRRRGRQTPLVLRDEGGVHAILVLHGERTLSVCVVADLRQALDDVVERWRLTRTVERDRERARDFARASGDWLWETDARHVCEWVSDNFQSRTGYLAERVLGRPALDGPLLDNLGQPLRPAATLLQLMDRHEELQAVCAMGPHDQRRTISLCAVPKRSADGRFAGFRGISRDVTDLIRLELASRERDAAERANRSKSEFLSRVSHELRTPLNAILGLSQLLIERRPPGDEGPETSWLRSVHRSGQYLLAMVNELLDLGRIEQGRLKLAIQDVPLDGALSLAQTVAVGDAGTSDVTLLVNLPPSRVVVRADPVALEQILVNLLSNAFKYNRPGGRIDVAVDVLGPTVRIIVADTGIGIPAARRAGLFEPFQRLGAENTSVPGSGLGLTIAQALVQKMNGSLEVESAEGVGTLCTLSLPRGQCDAVEADAPVSRLTGFDPLTERPMEVLYIEDDAVNQILMEEVVRALPDWRLRLAADRAGGLAALKDHRPDIVVVDMNLPDGSGSDVLAALRADARTCDLPCVALSADAMPDQVRAALEQGFDAYWTKPFNLRELRRRLASLGRRVTAPA